MKLVLVNLMDPLYQHYSNALISLPPLSLGVLYTLTPKYIDVSILDEQVDGIVWDGDVFAFYVNTQLAKKVYECADMLREKGKTVILGGLHVNACPQEAMQHADAIVTGEAELLWPQLCNELVEGKLKKHYKGSPTPGEKLSPIDRAAFKGKKYVFPGSLYATRGCVYSCTFCASGRLLGNYRMKQLDVVEKEIDAIRAAHGDVVLQFADDNPLADREWSKRFLALVRRKHCRFVCQITVDQLCDRALIDELAASGCLAVGTGVESLEQDNIGSVDKKQNAGRPVADAVRYARSKGIHVAALLIVGLENDTPERIEKAIKHIRSIPFSVHDVCILRPFPGTELYALMVHAGTTTPSWWLMPEPYPSNTLLPGYLRVYFRHKTFAAEELQRQALKFIDRLNRTTARQYADIIKTGMIAGAPVFALKMLAGRYIMARQARKWRRDLDTKTPVPQPIEPMQRTVVRAHGTLRPVVHAD